MLEVVSLVMIVKVSKREVCIKFVQINDVDVLSDAVRSSGVYEIADCEQLYIACMRHRNPIYT
jgi:hypothetical protein